MGAETVYNIRLILQLTDDAVVAAAAAAIYGPDWILQVNPINMSVASFEVSSIIQYPLRDGRQSFIINTKKNGPSDRDPHNAWNYACKPPTNKLLFEYLRKY